MVSFSVGNPGLTGKARKAPLFRSDREVIQNSDFFLYEALLYFNRLV